jgi:ribosomal protein S12 methylthiotransferase
MRIGIVTLGCDKNVVDNEYLAGLLSERGHQVELGDLRNPPDLVVITTCGFLDVARQQSLDEIQRWIAVRKSRAHARMKIAVIGCLAQRLGDQLREMLDGVDMVAGVGRFEEVVALLEATDCRAGAFSHTFGDPKVELTRPLPRRRLEPLPHSFLKISDGCDHTCSFCSIPLMKGRHRSVPRAILIEELGRLVAQGVREINLVAQDTTLYGLDSEGKMSLPSLLEDLCSVPGDFWLRLFYLYPSAVSDALIEVVAREPKIVKYLDIPLQHLDEGILRAMRRPGDRKRIIKFLHTVRRRIPGVVLRTTFIVGFPGETERAFETLLDGMEEVRFERLGAFCYSPEPDTPAMALPRAVKEKTSARRFDRLMRLQAQISADWTASQIGMVRRTLIEGPSENRGEWIGRSYSEAADVDGFIRVRSPRPLESGRFVDVRIEEADVYDMGGVLQEDSVSG